MGDYERKSPLAAAHLPHKGGRQTGKALAHPDSGDTNASFLIMSFAFVGRL